jgi:hypothetical protein
MCLIQSNIGLIEKLTLNVKKVDKIFGRISKM